MLESYAALIGILVGAGIFRVTTDAAQATGPSVILGYFLLAPVILASAVPYMVFLSSPLGKLPGGEYAHIRAVFGHPLLAFWGAWLKIIAYLGAGAYLASAFASYFLELLGYSPAQSSFAAWHLRIAILILVLFTGVHAIGIRWVGRLQIWMCSVLGLAVVVLVVPGLFHIQRIHYQPFFAHGFTGFLQSLPLLLFAFAGFESLAQNAGEVKTKSVHLPAIFAKGILFTTLIFLSISVVAFGVLPSHVLQQSSAPMSVVAATYLPFGAAQLVTIGALMAVTTSLNATMVVPVRLSWMLAQDGHLSSSFKKVHEKSGIPRASLWMSFLCMTLLLVSGQIALALNIAVVSLLILYSLHSFALLCLPGCNPVLNAEVRSPVARPLQVLCAGFSFLCLSGIVCYQFFLDFQTGTESSLANRWQKAELTSLELLLVWSLLGLLVYTWKRKG